MSDEWVWQQVRRGEWRVSKAADVALEAEHRAALARLAWMSTQANGSPYRSGLLMQAQSPPRIYHQSLLYDPFAK